MRRSYFVWGDSVVPPVASTTTLALLQDPYAFTQTSLLSPENFITEAKRRGVTLDREQLELLHRRRVLQPFYRVHSRPVTAPGLTCTPSGFTSSALSEVRFAVTEGRLSDPAHRRFASWPSQRRHPSLWYSHSQLLALRSISYMQTHMQPRPTTDRPVLHLAPLDARTRDVFERERSLAFLVEALAAKYRPGVVRSIQLLSGGDDEDLLRFINSDEGPPGLRQIELPRDLITRQADRLLAVAGSFDPLGAWSEVVRMADPRRWKDLRYDALIAHDYRIAAELLLRYVEHQAHLGITDPPEEPPPGTRAPTTAAPSGRRSRACRDGDAVRNQRSPGTGPRG